MSKKSISLLNTIESILILLLVSMLFYVSIPLTTPKNIKLPSSSSYMDLISKLHSRGYDLGYIDALLLKRLGKIQNGWIYIGKREINRLDFLRIIGSKNSRFEKITLIPGETSEIFLSNIAHKLDLNETKLKNIFYEKSPFKEAGILANTYNIPLRYNEKQVINYFLNLSQKAYKNIQKEYKKSLTPKEWKRVLIIASIIQKEAANIKEMPIVASVIYNRLKKRMRLQMDGTLNYGKYSHIKVTPKRIREDNSTYNTYKHKGLPKNPVCNIGVPAIKAALYPKKTDYLYFFRNDKGTHTFTKTYKEHLKNIAKKRKEGKNAN